MGLRVNCRGAVLIATLKNSAGFTLLEMAVIMGAIGILAAIAIPSWVTYLHATQLSAAHSTVYQAIQDAQGYARRNHMPWQASFRDLGGVVQWAIHPASAAPATATWNSFDPTVMIDSDTTLRVANNVYRVQFDEDGNVNGQLGRLTLSSRNGNAVKRCVIVSTLIGAIRSGQHRPNAVDSKACR